MRPAKQITDRAKRYRANTQARGIKWGRRVCHYCGKKKRLEVEHVDGNEANGAVKNLALACRSCNVLKSNVLKNARMGRRTRQFNPEPWSEPGRYAIAVLTLTGYAVDAMSPAEAVGIVQNTPHARRGAIAGLMRNPGARTLGEYVDALVRHTRGSHDDAGRVIHETPKSRRRSFAREIWDRRKSHAGSSHAEEVPF